MNGLMVMGTASDVGKTMLCTAFCRLLVNEGVKVAPFKSQNMSRFAAVLPDGKTMSRAQYLQAEAAKTVPIIEMNPILLQPAGNQTSNVFINGEKFGNVEGMAYRDQFFERGIEAIRSSLDTLAGLYEAVIIEGAGSPAEVNLNDRELVNMRVADMADVPVLLVADIERGGAIASIVGTLQLLRPEHRARVKAIIINKFHGDVGLFRDGIEFIESYTGIRVAGVIPFKGDHGIEEEDMERPVREAPRGLDRYDEWAAHIQSHVDWPFLKSLLAGEAQ
ncbi:cobyric acid synthase [Sporosarcina sp. Te-1]|uniref:cobyric acid synthase n=1 Tax=Sporosarcina sp. Te-1 TaxID=2818390 RepID=UPI001A9D421B|nr:cobyric acid synthase [Sporosarcina sp. Te-1]QTD40724.1 cobyric acid synthase [Sporosarcina sp. Te-1]